MNIAIAKHKITGAHYFLRLIRSDESYQKVLIEHYDLAKSTKKPTSATATLFNLFSTAKRHKQLIGAIDSDLFKSTVRLPTLFQTDVESVQPKRIMTTEECLVALLTDFEPVDARLLAEEMYLASPRELRANCSKNSPAAIFDAYSSNFAQGFVGLGNDFYVLVEPVQDWMIFRNFLTIGAALLANIQNPPEDGHVLEAAGFYSPKESAYNIPVFVIPIKFYAAKFIPNTSKDISTSNVLTNYDTDYLLSLYMNQADIHDNDSLCVSSDSASVAPVLTQAFANDNDVFISSPCNGVMMQRPYWYEMRRKNATESLVKHGINSEEVKEIDSPSELEATFEKDHNIYLCVKQKGSQIDMAKKIVLALFQATQNLKDIDGASLGLTVDLESMFEPGLQSAFNRYQQNSYVARMWNYLCFNGRYGLVACKHCGCCVMVSPNKMTQNNPQKYCSNSCRIQDKEKSNG